VDDATRPVLFEPQQARRKLMAWTRPKLREICVGMEINGYFAGKM
jgi:coenzyme PQQ precursor peptide PqqA